MRVGVGLCRPSIAAAVSTTMAYALGFFQGLSSVAYASDTIIDLIPCDTVAALVLASAAAAAAASRRAAAAGTPAGTVIYHAASSESYPLTVKEVFSSLKVYWSVNPPPVRLPFTKYVTVHRQHHPSSAAVARGRAKAAAKLRLLTTALKLAGLSKLAPRLENGFRAHCIANSLPYAASVVCCVDNVRALQAQMSPEERKAWPVLWEPGTSGQTWETYLSIFYAGVRCLLLKITNADNSSRFEVRPAACAEDLMAALLAEPSSSSSSSMSRSGSANSTRSSSTNNSGGASSSVSSRSEQRWRG